jgi:manganese/zinc/iron transport system ATP- binding protein
VRDYFDWLVVLNVRVVAQGPVARVYTAANLRRAYGGQIALIERAGIEETAAGAGG